MGRVSVVARAFLREEDGSTPVQWMYGLLLLLVLGGVTSGSLEQQWDRARGMLMLDVPVSRLLDR
jgi:Flp pilus assembly pilin Flp